MGQSCTCRCAPLPSEGGEFHCVYRLGVAHCMVESFLVIVTFLIIAGNIFGFFVFLASFLSLIGVSICVCCCPNYVGWSYNVLLQSLAFLIRFIVAIIFIAMISSSSTSASDLAVYVLCMIISSCTGMPFLVRSNVALKSLRVLPTTGDIVLRYPQEATGIPVVASFSAQPPIDTVAVPVHRMRDPGEESITEAQVTPMPDKRRGNYDGVDADDDEDEVIATTAVPVTSHRTSFTATNGQGHFSSV